MKIKGQTDIDFNNISISNLEYDLNLTHSDMGVTSKRKNGNINNGVCLESNLGPIIVKCDLLTEDNKIPNNIKDVNINLSANYKLEENLNIGLKYETDGEQSKYEILTGMIDSKVKNNNISLNLHTENILYGYKNIDNNRISLFGNKINPSVGLMNEQVSLGYIYNQIEEIDEYGNKDNKNDNKISLNLDFKI